MVPNGVSEVSWVRPAADLGTHRVQRSYFLWYLIAFFFGGDAPGRYCSVGDAQEMRSNHPFSILRVTNSSQNSPGA